ncbi:MAG: transcriptional repressor LexA [Planctomycetaceae bacterium]
MNRKKKPVRRSVGRPLVETITDAQRRTLEAIRVHIDRHGSSPTLKELAKVLGLAMTPVNESVRQLIRKGYVTRTPNVPRSLAIVREPESDRATGFMSIGLYGVVAAGQPVLADENRLGEALVPARILRCGRHFALKVQGDSMIGAGIHDGDTVIVREQPLAQNGQIVVAVVDGETTLKRLHFGSDVIELRPENKRFKPIQVTSEAEFRILGVVVADSRQWTS